MLEPPASRAITDLQVNGQAQNCCEKAEYGRIGGEIDLLGDVIADDQANAESNDDSMAGEQGGADNGKAV